MASKILICGLLFFAAILIVVDCNLEGMYPTQYVGWDRPPHKSYR
ncbi:hypothetical protein COLO4_13207 [Corchorus olitorius]|uniref:Uncharacterized protein n=1 Tax=Corchorus olitorius TaxID=93759 RepID=A0A1R3JXP6_9ROSI|nr:hypothetical protein COLO4_13207 [Corchorus olitorius]